MLLVFFLLLQSSLVVHTLRIGPLSKYFTVLHRPAFGDFDVSYSVNVIGQYFYIWSSICHINLGHMYVCMYFFFLSMSKLICSPFSCYTCLFILSQKTITGKLTCCMLQEVNNRCSVSFLEMFLLKCTDLFDTDTSEV